MDISLNPELDVDSLSQTLKSRRRLQIPDFLTAQSARKVHRLVMDSAIWTVGFNEGAENFDADPKKIAAAPPHIAKQFMDGIHKRARDGFQYIYNHFPITEFAPAEHPMQAVAGFVNSEEFLEFMRQLSGKEVLKSSELFASSFGPGHFLSSHDDEYETHGREMAFVLNLTPQWRPDWGGHLLFYDSDGNVTDGFVPTFNALNIFLVPQRHAVGYVAPFAGQRRISLTGWVRNR